MYFREKLDEKRKDTTLRLWNHLVHWTVEPIKALTFPYAYDFDSPEAEIDWIFYAYDGVLLLDRLRLAAFKISKYGKETDLIVKWTADQIKKIIPHHIS